MERWSPGDTIVRREVWRGRPWLAHPLYVVDDTVDLLVLYQAEGAPWGFGAGHWPTEDGRHPYHGRTAWVGEGPLGLHRPGDPYAVWAYWGGPDRSFIGWYVNIQAPFQRTSIGIDSLDLELDLLLTPELHVSVKDEEHVDRSAVLGRFTTGDAVAIHAVGARLKDQIEREGAWWDKEWSTWTPPAELREVPTLVEGWEQVPGTVFSDLTGRF